MREETIGNRRFFVYELTAEEVLDSVVLGMLENNPMEGLVPVTFLRKDEQRILRYDITGMTEWAEFANDMQDGMKLAFFLKSMADTLLEAEEYMIEEDAFLFDLRYVMIGEGGAAKLICLPVENQKGMEKSPAFCQFCSVIVEQPAVAASLSSGVKAQLLASLTEETFSIREFSRMLDQMELQSAVYRPRSAVQQQSGPVVFGKRERVKKEKAVQKVSRQTEPKKIRGYLCRKSTNQKIEIDREEFCIGKGREHTDYCIRDNSFISRRHAKIIRQGKDFYITDLHSLNHTFVNQKKLKEGQSEVLPDGTVIRLANEEFIFLTEEE